MRMISTIHDATVVDKGRKDRKIKNMEIKKPYAIGQYDKFLKGIHIRSELKLETFVNSALFCFTNGLVLRNSIQWRSTRLSICSF